MHLLPLVVATALTAVAGSLPSQTLLITFEEPGIVAMSNVPGAPVPLQSRVADGFVSSHGASFRSLGGFVAVADHGQPTPTPPNVIGGTSAAGTLSYAAPITIRFWDLADPTRPAGATDFVRVRGDLVPLNSGTVTMEAFTVDDVLIGSVTVPDVGPIGTGAVLTLSISGIHRVEVTGSSGTVAFDSVEFHAPQAAATFAPFGVGCPGALGIPTLGPASGSLPRLGSSFALLIGGAPNGVAILAIGLSNAANGPTPLPFDLGAFGMPGCSLRVGNFVTEFLLGAGTTVPWSLGLPTASGFLGLHLFFQAAVPDATANVAGISVTNAGVATLGF